MTKLSFKTLLEEAAFTRFGLSFTIQGDHATVPVRDLVTALLGEPQPHFKVPKASKALPDGLPRPGSSEITTLRILPSYEGELPNPRSIEPFQMIPEERILLFGTKPIKLTNALWALFELFQSSGGYRYPTREICNALGKTSGSVNANVFWLRKRLGEYKYLLESIPGGYRWRGVVGAQWREEELFEVIQASGALGITRKELIAQCNLPASQVQTKLLELRRQNLVTLMRFQKHEFRYRTTHRLEDMEKAMPAFLERMPPQGSPVQKMAVRLGLSKEDLMACLGTHGIIENLNGIVWVRKAA